MQWLPDGSLLMKGRLARRTFVLLLIAASLPIALATWLIVGHTEAYVDEQSHQRLTLDAKKYGLGVFQRLELAAIALASAPAGELPAPGERRPKTLTSLDAFFSSVVVLEHDAPDADAPPSRTAHLSSAIDGEAPLVNTNVLRIVRDANGTNAVALIHAAPGGLWRVGVLRHDYLWQPTSITGEILVRVSDGGGKVLFASLPEGHRSREARSAGFEDSAKWELFLQQRFAAGKWKIDLVQPHSEVKLEFARHTRTLLFTLIPLVSALVFFCSIAIRRSHRPLESLTAATHRIAAGDFSSKVAPSGDADMRSLALAFNEMTRHVGRQFETLAVFSQLDRQILSSSDLKEIVHTVLEHARNMLPYDQLAVLLLDEDYSDIARMHIARASDNLAPTRTRMQIPPDLHALLRSAEAPFALQATDGSFTTVRSMLMDNDDERAFQVLPIRTDKGVQGALLLACSPSLLPDRATLSLACGLAERMAVAISNADRQNALVKQAHFDGLTQLPNRLLFKDRLAQQIVHCQRTRTQFAVLFLDLDRFKNINDSFGHTSGDELLKGVAGRLVDELRAVDTIARLGGDEFTVIAHDIESPADAANVAQSVIAALSRPILLGEIEHFVSASIGIAIYPQDGVTIDALLRNADIAMYRAKAAGAGRFAYYEEAMNREAMERVELENELRHALARDELSVVYQPRVEMNTGRVIGVEALSRWRHPRLGIVSPDRFIRIAEESGLILSIGDHVLRQVCEQYHRWRRAGIEMRHLAVNVSVRQLQAPGFAQTVRQIIDQWRIPAGVLEIEITESVLATDIEYLTSVLNELHAMEVQISIDDFGTGYSSLSYLRQLPIDTLKVDRSFLPPPGESEDSAALCEAILAMSKALHLSVIAEGVETPEQVRFLLRHGCSIAQGFYFSRPITAQEITERYGEEIREARFGS